MAKDKVFLDSSVLITAVLSVSGGSFYILSELREKFSFQVNQYVLDEIIGVLDKKFAQRPYLKSRLFLIVGWSNIQILPNPKKEQLKLFKKFLNKEDLPILASALKHSDFLLTLDNDFLEERLVKFATDNGLAILRPKEFIEQYAKINS